MNAVDTYVDQNVAPEFKDIVTLLRETMREVAPHVTEQMSYGLPMWKDTGYIAYISPSKDGILFGFPYGATFDDPHDVLRGRGKHARHIRMRRRADVEPDVLRYYAEQAVLRDAAHEGRRRPGRQRATQNDEGRTERARPGRASRAGSPPA